ncbi:hypothetical protein NDU88_005687 [Pleurodeles waltl]|uniref:Uncharacterized protein n=1 Tax=Pleurodeles waltl TaxID=8319 RepID=A0AAV7UJY7_PLEWA|nr:hypothetical protein NDU88_005687 [Pleurodeles waltl]
MRLKREVWSGGYRYDKEKITTFRLSALTKVNGVCLINQAQSSIVHQDTTLATRRSPPTCIQRGGRSLLLQRAVLMPRLHLLLSPKCATTEDKPWTVTRCQGSLVVVERGSEKIARNVSWFKKFHPPRVAPGDDLEKDPLMAEPEEAMEDNEPENSLTDNGSVDNDQVPLRPDNMPVMSPCKVPSPKGRAPQSRYWLRSNPTPSTRLQD